MPTVREFFIAESRDYLDALRAMLAGDAAVDADALLRHARALRGGAQMAGEPAVARLASALESGARAIGRGELTWSAELRALVRDTVSLLRDLVAHSPDGDDGRVADVLRRWHALGIEPADGSAPASDDDATRPASAARAPPAFRAFAATQAHGVLSVLDRGLDALRDRPRDREPLKALLRRQRALLGAAALDSLPVLAETLRAIDEVTRLVARAKPAVTGDWLEPYLAARDALAWAVPRLRDDEPVDGEPDALRRLRAARDRLVAAHGETGEERRAPGEPALTAALSSEDRAVFRGEAATLLDRMARLASELATAPEGRRAMLRRELREAFTALSDNARAFGFADAATLALTGRSWLEAGDPAALDALLERLRARIADDESSSDAAVPIERLLYRGDTALRRALELRPRLEAAVGDEPGARAALEEVFDLIRLALE